MEQPPAPSSIMETVHRGGDDCKETVQPMDFGCSLYLVHNNKEDHP